MSPGLLVVNTAAAAGAVAGRGPAVAGKIIRLEIRFNSAGRSAPVTPRPSALS